MSTELAALEKVKLIMIDTDHFSDDEAWTAFLDLELSSSDEVFEIAGAIEKHRPILSGKLLKYFGI